MEEEDEIVELFVQTQAVAYSSEMARRRLSEQEDEEERDKAPTPLHFNDLPDIMILQIFCFLTPEDLVKSSKVCRLVNKN